MTAIFVSYSSADRPEAAEVQSWLRSKGHRSVFLDYDPENGIPDGENWEQELYRRLRACRVVIVLCSEASMASKWVFAEITQARALGKAVLPVRINDCKIDRVISDRQVIDMTIDRDRAYQRLWRALERADIQFGWDGIRPPYPGLYAFEEEDVSMFFGRDEEIEEGLDQLNYVRRFGLSGFVLMLGASGSGKSSLLRAGLIPRLKRDPERWLVLDPIRPRSSPFQSLAQSMSDAFPQHDEARGRASILEALDGSDRTVEFSSTEQLESLIEELLTITGRTSGKLLLPIDQFEELLSAPPHSEATRFLRLLGSVVEPRGSRLVVVGTMRSDFLGEFQASPALRDLRHSFFSVPPLSHAGLVQVIEKPAELTALVLEDGLASQLIADTEAVDALPLLAFTLRELYDRYGQDHLLELSEYRQLGGVAGAVATVASGVTASEHMDAREQAELRRAFLSMVRVRDGKLTRRAVAWESIPKTAHPVLNRFVDARLLTSNDGALEVSHEALFECWDTLSQWLEDEKPFLTWHESLSRAIDEWSGSQQHPDLLLRGRPLTIAESWLLGSPESLTDAEVAFIEESRANEDRQDARRKAKVRVDHGRYLSRSIQRVSIPLLASLVFTLTYRLRRRGFLDDALADLGPSQPNVGNSIEQLQWDYITTLEGAVLFVAGPVSAIFIAAFATAVFSAWLVAIYQAVRMLTARPLPFDSRYVSSAIWTPLLNLYRPRRVLGAVLQALLSRDPKELRTWLIAINLWWLFWCASLVFLLHEALLFLGLRGLDYPVVRFGTPATVSIALVLTGLVVRKATSALTDQLTPSNARTS